METRQQRLIRRALEASSKPKTKADAAADTDEHAVHASPGETSLQNLSLKHTDPDYVPRTLTPHEWEAYYRERGIPAEHRQGKAPESAGGLLKRLGEKLFGEQRSPRNRGAGSGH